MQNTSLQETDLNKRNKTWTTVKFTMQIPCSWNHHNMVKAVHLPTTACEIHGTNMVCSIIQIHRGLSSNSVDTFNNVIEAVMTKMEAQLDPLLDRFHAPPTFIIYMFLFWAVAIRKQRGIPMSALWMWMTNTSEKDLRWERRWGWGWGWKEFEQWERKENQWQIAG